MQDRVLGPLTMAQFIYVVIGGGLTYSIYSALPSTFGLLLAAPVALLTICIGFVKVNERPFWYFLFSVFDFLGSPRQRVWHHDPNISMNVEIYKPKTVIPKTTIPSKNISREQIKTVADQFDK